jgi:hypothetical protein
MRLLRALWRVTLRPVYDRLFGTYFQISIGQLHELRGEFGLLRSEVRDLQVELHNHISGINERQGAVNADVVERLADLARRVEALDSHVRDVAAARWDLSALARRMASLEDRIEQDGSQSQSAGIEHASEA